MAILLTGKPPTVNEMKLYSPNPFPSVWLGVLVPPNVSRTSPSRVMVKNKSCVCPV